ncbi:hypothetical protein [uncultured Sulfitobacter sp.]|uniref:hypothetical protein n=1 Tax=uncultured Sulfitobacter sp. TaxID=191468 RepID=UPI002620EEE3|nr:hypothetical protein [uncultured Sulfitobacter sp.]
MAQIEKNSLGFLITDTARLLRKTIARQIEGAGAAPLSLVAQAGQRGRMTAMGGVRLAHREAFRRIALTLRTNPGYARQTPPETSPA